MKGLALETVVKWIILIVVAGVVINLLFFFSDEIKNIIWGYTEEKIKTEDIESNEFSTAQVKAYIRICWGKTGERFQEDFVCYILRGSVINVNPTSLTNAVEPPAYVDISKFNINEDMTIIKFEDVGNKIIVES